MLLFHLEANDPKVDQLIKTFQEEEEATLECEDEREARQKATDKRTTVTSGKEECVGLINNYCYKNSETFILLHSCSFTDWNKSLGCHLIGHVGSGSLAVPNCDPTSATPGTCLSSQGWVRQYRNLNRDLNFSGWGDKSRAVLQVFVAPCSSDHV